MSRQNIGALWKRSTESGKTFLSGTIEETRFDGTGLKLKVSIWPNDAKKDGSKQPDCIVYLDEYKPAAKPAARAAAPVDDAPFPGDESAPADFPDAAGDDDAPF